jgi:hypothetical protein
MERGGRARDETGALLAGLVIEGLNSELREL